MQWWVLTPPSLGAPAQAYLHNMVLCLEYWEEPHLTLSAPCFRYICVYCLPYAFKLSGANRHVS